MCPRRNFRFFNKSPYTGRWRFDWRKEGANQSHRVRRAVVHQVLQWFVTHNVYYRANCVRIDPNALTQLLQDGNLANLTSIIVESPADSDQRDVTPDTCDLYDSHLAQSFVPIAAPSRTEQEAVQLSVHQRQSTSPTPAWSLHNTHVAFHRRNEFTTEGYFSCAFPTLFPAGAADFSGHWQNSVTIGNYFKHLLMYDDSRFAKHLRFHFFAEMRWRALKTGRVYVRQYPGDAQVSLDELRDMVGRGGEAFSNRVLHYASSLCRTKQYWFRLHSRLLSMVDTLGLPTIFFTHSVADLQWPELARCMERSTISTFKFKVEIPHINITLTPRRR